MKRKIKVFTTLASLCLTIMLLTFGVFAATSVSYTLGGTIGFEVSEPYGTISLASITTAPLATGTATVTDATVAGLTYGSNIMEAGDEFTLTADGSTDSKSANRNDYNYEFKEDKVAYKFVFNVSTLNTAPVKITTSLGAMADALNISQKVVCSDADSTITSTDAGVTVTYYLYLENVTVNAPEMNYSINIALNLA